MNVKSSNLVGQIVSGVSNSIFTIITIVGFGWKIHREIVKDITENEKIMIHSLEEKINQSLSTKLEKEPATFKLEEDQKNISLIQDHISEIDKKIATVQNTVDEIRGILKKKEDITFK